MSVSTETQALGQDTAEPRLRRWPLLATLVGALGIVSTLLTDRRPQAEGRGTDYTVSIADIPGLDHLPFRIGGFTGYLTVAAILVLAATWHRRVGRRWDWSLGAHIVTFGLVSAAATLTLAYGWKGALGNYLHGAVEHGAYDDQGLYTYYVMNDFSPYIGWVPVAVALGGIAWMAFGEHLVSRGLGAFCAVWVLLAFGSVAATGVPGLPFIAMLGLVVVGIWLALGRSRIVKEAEL